MRSGAVVLGFVSILGPGCGFHSTLVASDAAGDGPGSGSDGGAACTLASLLDRCQLMFTGDLVTAGPAIYDTTMHTLRIDGAVMPVAHQTVTIDGAEVDVLPARNVNIAAGVMLRAIGTRPLAIAAMGSITIGGSALIDVSRGGAGARASCANGSAIGAGDVSGGGGGGGGGFGADGGNGGNGNGNTAQGGAMGHAVAALPAGLVGGCPGAPGGNGKNLVPGGMGGAGGGALYLVAMDRIQLDDQAVIDAGGAGGQGGHHANLDGDAGGGGGGSGGMVILQAPHVVATTAVIVANGGGGGGGADGLSGGGDGSPGTQSVVRATGGSAAPNGTDGGRGGVKDGPSGDSVTDLQAGGAGGGGGGVGIIRILSIDAQLDIVSPAPR